MSSKTSADRLTPRQRFARGLKYSTVGPVDVTRGALGIGLGSAHSSATWLGERYRSGKLRKDLAAAQETIAKVVANLPQALQEARRSKRRPRPIFVIAAGAAVLAVGAVSFSIIRRSTQPDPSPLPPSVDVTPKP
jgi:hypothetical protein